jgi:TIR domain
VTGPGAIDRPTVFLSHAVTDLPIAQVLHDEITRIFAGGVDVYASSVPGVVRPGQDWLASVSASLTAASAVVVVVTPVSVNRPWIWFEVGASWSKMEQGDGLILPLVYGIQKGELPEPLGRLQAMSLSKAGETREVFQRLVDNFGFGSMKGFRHASIKSKLPSYADLKLADADLASGTIYAGPYQDYSDDELLEVLADDVAFPAWRDWQTTSHKRYGVLTLTGRLVHFRKVDEKHNLPPGTAKRLLLRAFMENLVAVKVIQQSENTARLRVDEEELQHFLDAADANSD